MKINNEYFMNVNIHKNGAEFPKRNQWIIMFIKLKTINIIVQAWD